MKPGNTSEAPNHASVGAIHESPLHECITRLRNPTGFRYDLQSSESYISDMRNIVSFVLKMTVSAMFLLSVSFAYQIPSTMIDSLLNDARRHLAPDRRTVVFDVHGNLQGNTLRLTGELHNAELKSTLLHYLGDRTQYSIVDSLIVLPQASLGNRVFAVVSLSVANIRTKPDHEAEMATQAILGTPLKVLKKASGWYYVQTPDDYLGWTDDLITFMTMDEYSRWAKAPKVIVTTVYGFTYTSKKQSSQVVSDVVIGSLLRLKKDSGTWYEVAYPDGRTGFLAKAHGQLFKVWLNRVRETDANIVSSAKRFFGIPYLWGGTSAKGFDCSGFTKTVFFLNGVLLPRDANQQAAVGEPVAATGGLKNLKTGDLLFFGSKAAPGKPERLTHVAIYLGNKRFIHCSGDVRMNSLNPADPDYSEFRDQSFVRATRIIGAGAQTGVRRLSELPSYRSNEP